MKHLFPLAIALASLIACNDSDGDKDPEIPTDTNESVTTDTSNAGAPAVSAPADSATASFIKKAASGGMMEVQLGQIAQQQAENQRVKDFGSMMVRDHSAANNELKSIASTKSVLLTDSLLPEHRHHLDDLKSKKGAAFDRAYMKMMVQDHQKDVSEFEKASNNLPDAEVKAFATRTLPTLKTHLDSAKAINSSRK